MVGHRHARRGEPFQRRQRPPVQHFGGQGGGEVARIHHQPAHQPLAEIVIGGGREKIIMAKPGGQPRAADIRRRGDGIRHLRCP